MGKEAGVEANVRYLSPPFRYGASALQSHHLIEASQRHCHPQLTE